MSIEFDDLGSLYTALSEPCSWWNLELTPTEIKTASAWKKCWQWICSFFTSGLRTDLRGRVRDLAAALPQGGARVQIVKEKVARLVHSRQSWLFEAIPNVQDPPRAASIDGGRIESPAQPYEANGRYYNYPGEDIWGQFWTTIGLLFPGALSDASHEDLHHWHRTDWQPCARSVEPKITWLGHAGMLIQAQNINLLFDPTFTFVGPCFRRHTAPPISLENLPLIDCIGISHNHGDHFDQDSLRRLAPYQPAVFAPHRLDEWFLQNGFEQADGKKWWESSIIERDGRRIKLTAMPAQHGSQTSLSDLNRSLWMGIMVEIDNFTIYFAGDTGYNEGWLNEIHEKFPHIDAACIPIAPEGEESMHFNIQDSLRAAALLQPGRVIPIHYGAYRTGTELVEDPINQFREAVAHKQDLAGRISVLQLGETLVV